MKSSADQIITDSTMGKALYILFYVNNNLYAVELMYISRIIEIGQIYPVLGNVSYIPGIIKVIDDIWTVSDLRKKFGKELPKTQGHLLGILLRYKDFKICIIIDKVKSIITINPAKITPPFDRNNYFSGTMQLENEIVSFISLDNLFCNNSRKDFGIKI